MHLVYCGSSSSVLTVSPCLRTLLTSPAVEEARLISLEKVWIVVCLVRRVYVFDNYAYIHAHTYMQNTPRCMSLIIPTHACPNDILGVLCTSGGPFHGDSLVGPTPKMRSCKRPSKPSIPDRTSHTNQRVKVVTPAVLLIGDAPHRLSFCIERC